MEQRAYELLSNIEDSWWYWGRAKIVQRLLSKYATKRTRSILDYGAGKGGMFEVWSTFSKNVDAYEPSVTAREEVQKRRYAHVFATEAEALHTTYDIISLCDVLEHIENDVDTLRRIGASLANDGNVIVTVPAFQWLWSEHDTQHHHFRRYTTSDLRRVFDAAGLEVTYVSYWNMSIFFPAALMRLLGESGASTLCLPTILDSCLRAVLSIEVALMRFFPLPFGLGVVIVGKRIS